MADELYRIVYDVVDKAGPKIDGLIAKLTTLDTLLTTVAPKLRDLGTGNRGLGSVNRRLGDTATVLQAVGVHAVKTQAGLKTVGDGVPPKVDKGAKSVEGFGSSMLALQAGMMVVQSVTEALDAMGDSAVKAREFQDRGGQSGLDKRGKAREYATLMSHEGPDDAVMSRLFSLGKAGGYKFDDATKYGEQFLGSSPAGVQAGHVTPDQLSKLEVEGARFANRIGLDPATGGDIAGVIPQYVDMTKNANGSPLTTDQGVNKAMGQLGALQYGLNEGRGKITTLMRSEIGAAAPALAAGRIKDHAEMGAFVGIASTFSKSASSPGTNFKQMDALINNSEGDEGSDQKGDYLKRIGVAGVKGDLAKLRALKADVDAQRKADPALDVSTYLTSKGFNDRAARDSTIGYLANFDVLEKRTVEARKRAEDGQAVVDANRRYSTSLEGQNQLADAAAEKAEYDQTAKRQRLVVARKFALGQLRDENKIDTKASNFEDWAKDFVLNGFDKIKVQEWSGDQKTTATRIDDRVRENLAKSARAAGIDFEGKYPGFIRGNVHPVAGALLGGAITGHLSRGASDEALDRVMGEVGPELEKKGIGLDGSGSHVPAGRKLRVVMPPSLGGSGDGSGFDTGGDPLGDTGGVVDAVDQVGNKIDRQTAALVSAIRGMGGSRASAMVVESPGDTGAGFNPGRR